MDVMYCQEERSPQLLRHKEPMHGLDGTGDMIDMTDLDSHCSDTDRRSSSQGPLKPIKNISRSSLHNNKRRDRGLSSADSVSMHTTKGFSTLNSVPHPHPTPAHFPAFGPMPPPSIPARTFAPALALRKPKTDLYDPEARLVPKDDYSYMAPKADTEVRGTWSVIDPESDRRYWDETFEREKSEQRRAESEGRPHSKRRSTSRGPRTSWADAISTDFSDTKIVTTFKDYKSDLISATSEFTEQQDSLEKSDADIDPEVRSSFIDVRHVMRENERPLSAFEQRNKAILIQKASAPIKVIIGGQVVNTLEQHVDRRAELRDREGRYLDGKHRGLMKKRYEEEWKRRVEERDEQMVQATKERRAWLALSPNERERRLQKVERNKQLVALLGAGLNDNRNSDVYTYEGIPAVYLRTVNSDSISSWSVSNASETASTAGSVLRDWRITEQDDDSPYFSMSEGRKRTPIRQYDQKAKRINQRTTHSATQGRPWHHRESRQRNLSTPASSPGHFSPRSDASNVSSRNSDSTIRAVGRHSREQSIASSIDTRSSVTSSTNTESTLSAVEDGPELASPLDLIKKRDDFEVGENDSTIEKFDKLRVSCTKRGRIVSLRLHEPVQYSTSAIAERIFSGKVQEIQYFPAERMALVIFLFPHEASSFVRHVHNVRENDSHGSRALQVDVDWYKGLEIDAVYPAQLQTLASTLSEHASRVLLVSRIPVKVTTAEFAHDMKLCFSDKIFVKVAIIQPTKRYVREREGNMAILEFASIRDAAEVMERFKSRVIADYQRSAVEWTGDSCERAPAKMPYCDCSSCGG